MDWKGKSRDIYVTMGASSHTDAEREKNETKEIEEDM